MSPERVAAAAAERKAEKSANFSNVLIIQPEVLLDRHHRHEIGHVTIRLTDANVVRH